MPQYLIWLTPCRETLPEDATEAERGKVAEHFSYLQRRLAEGALILAGRTQEPPYRGIAIIEAEDRAQAETIMQNDPAVLAGVFTAQLQECAVALMRGRD